MGVYAYADETIFDIDVQNGVHAVGYGIFISKEPICADVISEAMQNLRDDPEFDIFADSNTLKNRYFHASEDSKNAHSHFCTSIRKHIRGRFNFTYYTLSKQQPIEISQQERFLNSCLNGSSIEFFNSIEEVNLTIEGRTELTDYGLMQWKDKIYKLLDGISYEIPSFKTFFPKINIHVGSKLTPGLQVADFLSWATCRTLRKPEHQKWKIWFDRLKFTTSSAETTEGISQKGIDGYLNETPKKWVLDYPQIFVKSETNDDVINAYINIERFIRNIDKSDFSSANFHLWQDFSKTQQLCVSMKHFQKDDLRVVARTFIRIFDSLPIYSNISDADKKSWIYLFHAKEIATLLIRTEAMHMVRTQDYIQRWRYKMLTDNTQGFLDLMQASGK